MRNIIIFIITLTATIASAQLVDPYLQALLDELYLKRGAKDIGNEDLADGVFTTNKFVSPLNLNPNNIIGIALIQSTAFQGPNISGTYSNLQITGFYSESNPDGFQDASEVLAIVTSQGFISGPDVPANETDPTRSGLSVTNTWLSASNKVTNVQIFVDGLLQSWTSNGVPLP